MRGASGREVHDMAIAALVCGIASWVIAPIAGSVIAIVCGHVALKAIRESAGRYEGEGYAYIGLALGYVHIAVVCLAVTVWLILFGGILGFLAVEGASHH